MCHDQLRGREASVVAFRGYIAPLLRGTLNFSSCYKSCRCRITGNLERGIFHGTRYTGHNKIRTPPIFDSFAANVILMTIAFRGPRMLQGALENKVR